ncbi:MAG: aspartate aminotransferase family protein [Phycisphaerae bacterium]|nr:aspartate aminotransferase family protein [Phycisphaerae bacterium]
MSVGGPHLDSESLRALSRRATEWIARYWARVGELPVLSRAAPGQVLRALPEHPPEVGIAGAGDSWDRVFDDLDRIVLPGLTHWQSPRFFAYFPANISTPSVIGELLGAGLGVQGMLWFTSPACTELETRVLDWMAELIGLPGAFRSTSPGGGGVIQGTASEGALSALVAGRDRVRRAMGAERVRDRLTVYASTQAHSSVIKAAMVAGLADGPDDRRRLRLVDVDGSLAMRPEALAAAIRQDAAAGLVPCLVCATVGTTGTTAVDPIAPIARAIADASPPGVRPWLHVDAALAGSACVCPEFRWMLDGVEHADSVCFNPHKWLLTNFDCDCFFTRDRRGLTRAHTIAPEYLRNAPSESGEVFDYRDWHVPLGRRFRSLKLWLVLRYYGAEGLREHVRGHVRLAALFESWVRGDPRFEIVAPRPLSLVCFRLRHPDDAGGEWSAGDVLNRRLLDALNATGRVFLTHTSVPAAGGARIALRLAVGSVTTREADVAEAWALVREHAGGVLGSSP